MVYPQHSHTIRGVTTLETIIAVVVAGVLSAIAIPSFLGWYEARQVDLALAQVESALNESQREAMTRGQDCTVTIPSGTEPIVTGNCLVTGDRKLKTISLSHNNTNTPWTITFDFRGYNNNVGDQGTMVLAASSNPNAAKCLVIAQGIGLYRTGRYSGTLNSPSPTACTTS